MALTKPDGAIKPTALDNRIVNVANVVAMKALTNLKVGMRISTAGYHTSGDGGGNEYEVVAAGTGTDDGGSFINLTDGVHQARGLFPGSFANVNQFGMTPGASDNTAGLTAALSFCKDNDYFCELTPGSYRILDRILLEGGNLKLIGRGGFLDFADGIVYFSDDRGASALNFVNMDSLTVQGVSFITDSTNGCSIVHARGCDKVSIDSNDFTFRNVSVGSKCAIIQRSETSGNLDHHMITNNKAKPGGAGFLIIGLSSSRHRAAVISGNSIIYTNNVSDAPIKVDKYVNGFVISGNTVDCNHFSGAGVVVEEGSHSGTIVGNIVKNTTRSGITLTTDPDSGGGLPFNDISVIGNHLTTDHVLSDTFGVLIDPTNHVCSNITIKGNIINGFLVGVREVTHGITDLIISNNDMLGIIQTGIASKSSGAVIKGNTIRGGNNFAISHRDAATDVIIVNNYLEMQSGTTSAIQQSVSIVGEGWVLHGNYGLLSNTLTLQDGASTIPLGAERVLLFPIGLTLALTLPDGGVRNGREIELIVRNSAHPVTIAMSNYNNAGATTLTLTGTGTMLKLTWSGYSWVEVAKVGSIT